MPEAFVATEEEAKLLRKMMQEFRNQRELPPGDDDPTHFDDSEVYVTQSPKQGMLKVTDAPYRIVNRENTDILRVGENQSLGGMQLKSTALSVPASNVFPFPLPEATRISSRTKYGHVVQHPVCGDDSAQGKMTTTMSLSTIWSGTANPLSSDGVVDTDPDNEITVKDPTGLFSDLEIGDEVILRWNGWGQYWQVILAAPALPWTFVTTAVDYTIPGSRHHVQANPSSSDITVTLPDIRLMVNGDRIIIVLIKGSDNATYNTRRCLIEPFDNGGGGPPQVILGRNRNAVEPESPHMASHDDILLNSSGESVEIKADLSVNGGAGGWYIVDDESPANLYCVAHNGSSKASISSTTAVILPVDTIVTAIHGSRYFSIDNSEALVVAPRGAWWVHASAVFEMTAGVGSHDIYMALYDSDDSGATWNIISPVNAARGSVTGGSNEHITLTCSGIWEPAGTSNFIAIHVLVDATTTWTDQDTIGMESQITVLSYDSRFIDYVI